MCLAFICGRGPKLSPSIEDKRPLVSEENVVHLGSRALDPLEAKAMRSSRLTLYSASEAHEIGISKVAREAASYLAERSDWVICHLDVDSIDPSVLAATNYHEAGQGLSLAEVRSIVDELYATSKLRVFNLAAYNPILDHDHESGRLLVSLISDIFSVNRSS
jgi:arginase